MTPVGVEAQLVDQLLQRFVLEHKAGGHGRKEIVGVLRCETAMVFWMFWIHDDSRFLLGFHSWIWFKSTEHIQTRDGLLMKTCKDKKVLGKLDG